MMNIFSTTTILLSILQFRSFTYANADSATVSTDGEVTIDNVGGCEPQPILGGKFSTCQKYQIGTLNSSPRRCIHIESSPTQPAEEESFTICQNFPNWFDGTNGCHAYATNPGYCSQYGHLDYSQHSQFNANQACCACGGGTRGKPRLQVGDYVTLKGYHPHLDQCKSLKIVKLETEPSFRYLLEVMKPCGPRSIQSVNEHGLRTFVEQFQPGFQIAVESDDPLVIDKYWRVELKKCRSGLKEQEFEFLMASEDGETVAIQHKALGLPLTVPLGGKSSFVNLKQVWEEGLFLGSDEFYFLKMMSSTNNGRLNENGEPYGPSYSFLVSGYFGEKEYSEVKTRQVEMSRGVEEQEFAMWTFKIMDDTDGDSEAVDEHVKWLQTKTQMIGIDYLEELAPWDLLDVDREASKSEVKSRFRELSRSFHPDKLVHHHEKKELFERIFVLLQSAYQGLKSADEKEKEAFRVQAESDSQLFTHSQNIVELLPIYWTKIESDNSTDTTTTRADRYILNVASHLNSTLMNDTAVEEEREPSIQIWVVFMYSARCGMSRTIRGMVDLAAAHLKQYDGIKVGAYGCGLYQEFPPAKNDPTGVKSDPICKQFERRETPNVHVIVETLPGKVKDENGDFVEVPLDQEVVEANAQFKHFYASVAEGNTTQFYPHNFIKFARSGKRVWDYSHLVRRMAAADFNDPSFIGNSSIVAFFDGTGNGDTDSDVNDAIRSALPGVAHRFSKDELYIGTANCGYGDDFDDNTKHVDCSTLDVSWLPDIKVYGQNDTKSVSLLRGQFGDRRDVQIGAFVGH